MDLKMVFVTETCRPC